MSTVDSNQSLNNILDKLGIQSQEQKKRADGSALGQEDFLKLMTTRSNTSNTVSTVTWRAILRPLELSSGTTALETQNMVSSSA